MRWRQLNAVAAAAIFCTVLTAEDVVFMVEETTEMTTLSDLRMKGVKISTAVDPRDSSLIHVSIQVSRDLTALENSTSKIKNIGYAIYDRPIDDAFCQQLNHRNIPVVHREWSTGSQLTSSFRTDQADRGYIVIKTKAPDVIEFGHAVPHSQFSYLKLKDLPLRE